MAGIGAQSLTVRERVGVIALQVHRSRLRAAAAVLVALIVIAPPAQTAATGTRLPLKGFNQLLVDREHRRVYVTGAPRQNASLVVLDFRGRVSKVIGGLPGAAGMALAENGSLLYVTLQTQRAIAVVDTKRLRRTRVFRLPATVGCPDSVAWAGGRVWFGYLCGTWVFGEGMASLDPATGRVRVFTEPRFPADQPRFATTPRRPGLLIAIAAHHQEASVFTYHLVRGTPRLVKWSPQKPMFDIALTKDGTRFVMTTLSPWVFTTFGVNDHRPSAVYRGTSPDGQFSGHPVGVSISPTERSLAAAIDDLHGPDIHLFRMGESQAFWRYDFGENGPYARGVAFGASPKQLFVVTGDTQDESVIFHVLRVPAL